MKKNVLITLGAATCILVSCNKNMTSITDDRAKQLAQEILTRQADSQLFTDPNNFICKHNTKSYQESFSRSGKSQTAQSQEITFKVDVEKLIYSTSIKNLTSSTSSSLLNEYEEVTFYDVGAAKLYILMSDNGYKYRRETSMDINDARSEIVSVRNGYENTYKWHSQSSGYPPFALDRFDTNLESVASMHEKLKDETDQHCNYYLGSNNAKSLQVMVDSKQKTPLTEYSGYSNMHMDLKIKSDLLENYTYDMDSNLTWTIDKRFYQKQNASETISMSYGNASIGIPNINDYPLSD